MLTATVTSFIWPLEATTRGAVISLSDTHVHKKQTDTDNLNQCDGLNKNRPALDLGAEEPHLLH